MVLSIASIMIFVILHYSTNFTILENEIITLSLCKCHYVNLLIYFSSGWRFNILEIKIAFHLKICFQDFIRSSFQKSYQKKTKMKCSLGQKELSLFLSHVLESKSIAKLQWTLSINSRKGNRWVWDETEILTLKVWFNDLCSIITYIFAQGYLN